VLEIGCPFGRAAVYWCMDATYSFAVVQRIYTFFSAGKYSNNSWIPKPQHQNIPLTLVRNTCKGGFSYTLELSLRY
jgi:hypothetical protein